jgi:hypothetical protein
MFGRMANPVLTFTAGLCLMGRDGQLVPYDTAPIEAASQADAIQLARQWAQDATLAEDSHLQVLLNGEAVARLKPGEF